MSVIALEKTWTTSVSVVTTGTAAERCQTQLYNLKTTLLSNGFSVALSSNGTSSGAADYWSSSSDLVYDVEGDPHAWIVLEHSSGYQICIDYVYSEFYSLDFFASYSGSFTGGSTTSRPTSSDEFQSTGSNTSWTTGNTVDKKTIFITDSSNENYFIFFGEPSSPYIVGGMMFGVPTSYDSVEWTEPLYIMKYNSNILSYLVKCSCRTNSINSGCSLLYPQSYVNYLDSSPGSYYGDLQAAKVYIISDSPSSPILGYIPDLYWVDDTAITNDYIADDLDTKRWLVLGVFAVPNDGSSVTVNSAATPTDYDSADLIDLAPVPSNSISESTKSSIVMTHQDGTPIRAGRSDIRLASFFSFTVVGGRNLVQSD